MTTIIISSAHICAWLFMAICGIIIVIMLNNAKLTPEKHKPITSLAIIMLVVSMLLIQRDWDHNVGNVLYCIDGFIFLMSGLTIFIEKSRLAIIQINAMIVLTVIVGIILKFILVP